MDPAPPLHIVNREEEYEVEEVWNYKKYGYNTQFLVHWKDYKNKYDQWIVESGLPHAIKVIEDY